MKYSFIFFLVSIFSWAQLPKGFVYVSDIIPDIQVELRYFSANNFIGKPIQGYKSNSLILTKQAALALKKIQEALQQKNLCLLVYDGYRPQQAVNHFVSWAKNVNDTINKQKYYPDLNKKNLFKLGYIASHSGHSRGSTIDLTIIDANTGVPLDMGSPYDYFGDISQVNSTKITENQLKNRLLLKDIMQKYGFRNYPKEWWHFTLRFEPFPKTYFNFLVE